MLILMAGIQMIMMTCNKDICKDFNSDHHEASNADVDGINKAYIDDMCIVVYNKRAMLILMKLIFWYWMQA